MKTALLFGAGLLLASTGASATVIDFESYTDPTNATTLSTSGATFSGLNDTTGFEVSTYGEVSWGTGAPNILCPLTDESYCGGDFEVNFDAAVTALTFLFTGDQSDVPLTVEAFLDGNSLGLQEFFGDGNGLTAHLVDLTSFGSIDRIVVVGASADQAGFGYDDFTFNSGAVPEPSTWAMMLLGFGAVGFSLRRSRRILQTA